MLPNFQHKDITPSCWRALGIEEQLANIGSEVERAIKWKTKGNMSIAFAAHVRALELFDLTLTQAHSKERVREIARARELWLDFFVGDNQYSQSDAQWQKYFYAFTLVARKHVTS